MSKFIPCTGRFPCGNIDTSEQQVMVNKAVLRADPQPDGSCTCHCYCKSTEFPNTT